MKNLTRRKFLKSSALLTAATAVGCSNGSSPDPAFRQAVVIGSGFAGSVAALRLGLAGIPTMVLERGQDWTQKGPDTFPNLSDNDRRKTWFGEIDGLTGFSTTQPWAGMIERVSGDTLDAACGAGVGGGSLVYGGALIQPRRQTFDTVFPQISYDDMDQIYYPRVLAQIKAGRIPPDVLASDNYAAQRAFIADTSSAGFQVSMPFTGFDWDVIREEIQGRRVAAASVSEYIYGCNSGAKLSTDKNYLRDALATGNVEIRSLTEVVMLSEQSDGGYLITCRRIHPDGTELERYELRASHLILAAGSLNTSKLLLKSQAAGELHGANDRIGQNWGTNGDQLMLELSKNTVSGTQGGPACIAAVDDSSASHPVTFMHSPASVPVNVQIQLAMSVPDSLGETRYDSAADKLTVHWPADTNTPSAQARTDSFTRLLKQSGGANISGTSGRPTVWHPLGGAVMGDACDHFGRLYGYENLFVIDSSLLPGSVGAVNPALTVAANAERIMEQLILELVRS